MNIARAVSISILIFLGVLLSFSRLPGYVYEDNFTGVIFFSVLIAGLSFAALYLDEERMK